MVNVNTTGVNNCILSASTESCTNGGATYMFWMKLFDNTGFTNVYVTRATIISTANQCQNEGYKLRPTHINIVRMGATTLIPWVYSMESIVGEWTHVALVWRVDPDISINKGTFELYFNGISQSVSTVLGFSLVSICDEIGASLNKMVVGRESVDSYSGRSPNMIFDELVMCDRPLTQTEIEAETTAPDTTQTTTTPGTFQFTMLMQLSNTHLQMNYDKIQVEASQQTDECVCGL